MGEELLFLPLFMRPLHSWSYLTPVTSICPSPNIISLSPNTITLLVNTSTYQSSKKEHQHTILLILIFLPLELLRWHLEKDNSLPAPLPHISLSCNSPYFGFHPDSVTGITKITSDLMFVKFKDFFSVLDLLDLSWLSNAVDHSVYLWRPLLASKKWYYFLPPPSSGVSP